MTREEFAELISPALEHAGSTHSVDDVLAMLARGEAQAWIGERSVLVTRIDDHPRAKVLTHWLGGGDLEEVGRTLRRRAEAWGKEQGCDRAWIIGRPGWERELKDEGFAPAARLLVKELQG